MITVEEFTQMPSIETEDYELVDGRLISLPGRTPLQAKIRQNLAVELMTYFASGASIGHVLAEVDCQLGRYTRPGLSIFLGVRLKSVDASKTPVPFAPDIAVELLPLSGSAASEYLNAGSQEVWQLDQENGEIFVQSATGIRLLRGEEALETPLLPGFSVSVNTILAGF